jgi:hypothetical protein
LRALLLADSLLCFVSIEVAIYSQFLCVSCWLYSTT